MPEKSSLMKAHIFEHFFEFIFQYLWLFRETTATPTIISGTPTSAAQASCAFFENIIAATAIIVMKFGIRLVIVFSSTSLSEFTLPTIRARILPLGLESKNARSSF